MFRLRDSNLRTFKEGITPAVVDVAPGLYAAEVWNSVDRRQRLLEVSAGTTQMVGRLGIAVDTPVPVHCALDRSQPVAEFVTTLSGRLRDTGSGSGLVIAAIPGQAGTWSQPRTVRSQFTLLDSAYHPIREVSVTSDNLHGGAAGASMPLRPGGYVIRVRLAKLATVDVPAWISAGYQTVAFIPWDDAPDISRISFHMLPSTSVWTGFDVASGILEMALENLRSGRRPFAEDGPGLDFVRISTLNPVLGLIRAHDLLMQRRDPRSVLALLSRLQTVVPGHPDLQACAAVKDMTFPPMTLSGQRFVRQYAADHGRAIVPGSLLDLSLRTAKTAGPWASWTADPKRRQVSGQPLPDALGPAALISPDVLTRAIRVITGFVLGVAVVFLLAWLPRREAIAVLGTGASRDQMTYLVRTYLSDLVLVGRAGTAVATLLGGSRPALARATAASRNAATEALDQVRRELWRQLVAGRRRFDRKK
ncbi:hypothetical protein [Amycolatopsis balhimycina]|uniref:hypothetical protein n=1 Tax=Amycolatopsis balhimycina TaxID=208443 RepID=UPI00146E6984|nr:hypothetical protein [Amycolatopsis balhimycina]